jgi:hypothetical protein
MDERLFPVPRPDSGDDHRFTFGLIVEVADVLARHGYPDIAGACSGADFVALRQALFGFLYAPKGGVQQ